MLRMVRKQIYIRPEQDAALKRRANELGITESELIRFGIDQVVMGRLGNAGNRAEESVEPATPDCSLAQHPLVKPDSERRWPRGEMYDERWDRRLSR